MPRPSNNSASNAYQKGLADGKAGAMDNRYREGLTSYTRPQYDNGVADGRALATARHVTDAEKECLGDQGVLLMERFRLYMEANDVDERLREALGFHDAWFKLLPSDTKGLLRLGCVIRAKADEGSFAHILTVDAKLLDHYPDPEPFFKHVLRSAVRGALSEMATAIVNGFSEGPGAWDMFNEKAETAAGERNNV